MCTVVSKKLGNREWFEDQSERRVADIVTEPLHTNLLKIPVIPLPPLPVKRDDPLLSSFDPSNDTFINNNILVIDVTQIEDNNNYNNNNNNNGNNDNSNNDNDNNNNNNNKEMGKLNEETKNENENNEKEVEKDNKDNNINEYNDNENNNNNKDKQAEKLRLSLNLSSLSATNLSLNNNNNNIKVDENENDRRIVHTILGPQGKDEEEQSSWLSLSRPFCSAISISTYPLQTIKKDGEESKKRDGSPICDQYKAIFYSNRAIMAMADGCNWGEAPKCAAIAARDAFVHYLHRHSHEITDLHVAGNLILRAFSLAHSAILLPQNLSKKSNDQSNEGNVNGGGEGGEIDSSDIGTTTLLGGIVLQLYADPDDPDCDVDEDGGKKSQEWGFVYGSVGDCKAFHWSCSTGKFSDITEGNRSVSMSASDCGGRLGPQMPGNLPDLRNFELGFFPCASGDIILLVSDGVHDNLDPALLGFAPRDVNIDSDQWSDLSPSISETAKIQFRLSLLEKIISNQINSANNNDDNNADDNYKVTPTKRTNSNSKFQKLIPQEIVKSLIKYCVDTCAPSAAWMQNNPNKRLPKDYRLYPGKMDHTTVMCYVVGEI